MKQLPPFAEDVTEQQSIWDYTIALGDETFRIVLTYRERQDRWYLNLYDSDGEPLIQGRKLVIDTLLLQDHVKEGMPAGDLFLFDTSASDVECGWADLGTRCELLYLEPDEIPTSADEDITITAGWPS